MRMQVRREEVCISHCRQSSHTPAERRLHCLRGGLHGGGGLLGVLPLVLAGGLGAALRAAVDDSLSVLVHLEFHDADLKFQEEMHETQFSEIQPRFFQSINEIRALWVNRLSSLPLSSRTDLSISSFKGVQKSITILWIRGKC